MGSIPITSSTGDAVAREVVRGQVVSGGSRVPSGDSRRSIRRIRSFVRG